MLLQTVFAFALLSVVLVDGCCTPKQWEGTEYVAGGYSRGFKRGGIGESFDVSYDARNRRVATTGRVWKREKEYTFKIIFNYNATRGYFILPGKQLCKSFALRRKFRPACIPDSARRIGSSYLGAGGASLDVNAYGMRYRDRRAYLGAVAMVAKEGCIPVSEDISGVYKGISFFENVNFVGITAGIKDVTVFSPPEYCQKETVDLIDEEFHAKYSMLQTPHPDLSKIVGHFSPLVERHLDLDIKADRKIVY